MARRKNLPESVRVKYRLSERLRSIRTELFGDRGGSEMARRLGIPVRTWYNYEAGVTVPAEILLKFLELTGVDPLWLLHGQGSKFPSRPGPVGLEALGSVEDLLRTALERLEAEGRGFDRPRLAEAEGTPRALPIEDVVLIRLQGREPEYLTGASGASFIAARREWLEACRDCRCVQLQGDAMAPILADGAVVAFSDTEEAPEALESRLIVTWLEGQPLVRWLGLSGRFALLRAENPAHEPGTILLDLDAPAPEPARLRRVAWISTPH